MMLKVFPEATKFDRPNFDAEHAGTIALHLLNLSDFDYVFNAAGKIKPYCDNVESAIKVNALFPYWLLSNTIQIATDCVYSGKQGSYVETDPHDALDIYGKTKSLGEAPHIKNLRCSIIGPELISPGKSLLAQFLEGKIDKGYTNHYWNGITTYHFSKIVQGVIREKIELPNVQHIVPADRVTKAELLNIIAKAYGKRPVTHIEASEAINRTLSTENPELNLKLWKAAGYDKPPTIQEMVEELSKL